MIITMIVLKHNASAVYPHLVIPDKALRTVHAPDIDHSSIHSVDYKCILMYDVFPPRIPPGKRLKNTLQGFKITTPNEYICYIGMHFGATS